jgi:ammonia channel protein AmtB
MAFVIVFAPIATLVILGALRMVMGSLSVDAEDEYEGLDLSQHSESAYTTGSGAGYEPSHGGVREAV